MSQKFQELTAQEQEVAAECYQQARERVLAWQQQLESQVREKPLQSFGWQQVLAFYLAYYGANKLPQGSLGRHAAARFPGGSPSR